MTLSELIAKHGDDKVQFQKLDDDLITLKMKNGHSKITFGTNEAVGPSGTDKMGLIVWLDRDRVSEIIAEEKKATADG